MADHDLIFGRRSYLSDFSFARVLSFFFFCRRRSMSSSPFCFLTFRFYLTHMDSNHKTLITDLCFLFSIFQKYF